MKRGPGQWHPAPCSSTMALGQHTAPLRHRFTCILLDVHIRICTNTHTSTCLLLAKCPHGWGKCATQRLGETCEVAGCCRGWDHKGWSAVAITQQGLVRASWKPGLVWGSRVSWRWQRQRWFITAPARHREGGPAVRTPFPCSCSPSCLLPPQSDQLWISRKRQEGISEGEREEDWQSTNSPAE